MTVDRTGITVCSRYAFAPNWYHYCGPQRQRDLLEYVATGTNDKGLEWILGHFETLFPYLQLIAGANHIRDPFDRKTVEAYWLGNALLDKVPKRAFADHLTDTLHVKKKVPHRQFNAVMDRAVTGVPNHTFHVLNIFMRTGHQAAPHTIRTMDQCRIGWGQITENVSGIKDQESRNDRLGKQYVIKTLTLADQNGMLTLVGPVMKTAIGIGIAPKVGDWVSMHWGYICEILDDRQHRLLTRYTRLALIAANRSL